MQATHLSADAFTSLVRRGKGLPFVLMADCASQEQKMDGLRIGAADFLEKPLSSLKLRNIWQHTVRKVRVLFVQVHMTVRVNSTAQHIQFVLLADAYASLLLPMTRICLVGTLARVHPNDVVNLLTAQLASLNSESRR